MRKPLNARSTKFVKIQTSARATLGANPASSASRHPISQPFSPAHGVSLSTRHCGSARAGQTHPPRVNAPTRVKAHDRRSSLVLLTRSREFWAPGAKGTWCAFPPLLCVGDGGRSRWCRGPVRWACRDDPWQLLPCVVSHSASAVGWVQMRCRECAAEVAVTARVCSRCGAPIVGHPPGHGGDGHGGRRDQRRRGEGCTCRGGRAGAAGAVSAGFGR